MIQTSAAFRRDTQGLDGSISLSEIISALSYALDLTEGAVHGHALRSCLLGMRIAEEAKLPSEQTSSLYFALLLKDIGCSRNARRVSQLMGGEDLVAKSVLNSEDWTRPHKPSDRGRRPGCRGGFGFERLAEAPYEESFRPEAALEQCSSRSWPRGESREVRQGRSDASPEHLCAEQSPE